MEKINNTIANMSKEELDMAVKEQDNRAIKTLTEAVIQQQEVTKAQDELITKLEKTLFQVVEVFQLNKKEMEAKLEVLAASLDRIEVQLGNRKKESRRSKPKFDSELKGLVDEATREVPAPNYVPDVKPPKQPDTK